MTENPAWHDLYWHGRNMAHMCKAFRTKFDHAEKDGNDEAMRSWGEALRKTTMNCTEIAKTVLGVEEIVRGKKRIVA